MAKPPSTKDADVPDVVVGNDVGDTVADAVDAVETVGGGTGAGSHSRYRKPS